MKQTGLPLSLGSQSRPFSPPLKVAWRRARHAASYRGSHRRAASVMVMEIAVEAEESAAAPVLHVLRSLAESSRADHMMEILSYVLSFGSFVVFVWVARCAVASPTFRPESGALSRLVFVCVSERPGAGYESRKKEKPEQSGDTKPYSFARDAARLATCTLGIQVSYLLWGLMQERIMTRPYSTGELFRSSKFLVFANRFLALLVACAPPAERAVLAVPQLTTLTPWAAPRTQHEPPSRSGPNAGPKAWPRETGVRPS